MQKVDRRRLILGGIVLMLAMIAWTLYLEYDKRQFIQSLPKLPQTRHQPDGATERLAPLPENREEQTVQQAPENVLDAVPAAPEDFTDLAEGEADTVFEEAFVEPLQASEATGLSPELEALFSAYDVLYTESVEVSKVLSPLLDTDVLATQRIREILSDALPNAPDDAARQVLYDEFDELRAWQEEVEPTIYELQDQCTQVYEERLTLLAEHGFSSEEEFLDTHEETYKAWKAEQ